MNLKSISTLYSYNAWGNGRILLASGLVTDLQFKRQPVAGLGSLRDILVHTLGAQWIWLSRWQGVSPASLPDAHEFPTLDSLRLRWSEVEGETQAFIQDLSEAALHREVAYTSLSGKAFSEPLWQLMLQQINHATQHRSEAAVLLTLFNFSPGDLDFIYYLRLVRDGKAGVGF
jgi:uncharacterized damage-inducible protein DinB